MIYLTPAIDSSRDISQPWVNVVAIDTDLFEFGDMFIIPYHKNYHMFKSFARVDNYGLSTDAKKVITVF